MLVTCLVVGIGLKATILTYGKSMRDYRPMSEWGCFMKRRDPVVLKDYGKPSKQQQSLWFEVGGFVSIFDAPQKA